MFLSSLLRREPVFAHPELLLSQPNRCVARYGRPTKYGCPRRDPPQSFIFSSFVRLLGKTQDHSSAGGISVIKLRDVIARVIIAICTFDNPARSTSGVTIHGKLGKESGSGEKQNQSITGLSFSNALLKRSSRTNSSRLSASHNIVRVCVSFFFFFVTFNCGLEFN